MNKIWNVVAGAFSGGISAWIFALNLTYGFDLIASTIFAGNIFACILNLGIAFTSSDIIGEQKEEEK
jgi:hypothetical protein